MATKQQAITPYNSASSSAEKKEKAGSVKVQSNMSKVRGDDQLFGSLGSGIPELPSNRHLGDVHVHIHSSGVQYNPAGEFGKVAPKGKGQGVYSYGGAPNKKGDNPLGRALNKVGEKSGYKSFKPSAGGKKP